MKEAAALLDGRLSCLVNCAGVLKGGAVGAESTTRENLMFNLQHNTISVFEMLEHAAPYLKEAGAADP